MKLMVMMTAFAPLFSQREWPQALLPPGQRTVSQILRVMGLAEKPKVQRYPQGLNWAVWSFWQASRIVLGLLVRALNFEATSTRAQGTVTAD